jgi:hypothetical protein
MIISVGIFRSSIIYHYSYTDIAKQIDKWCIYAFVVFGGYTFYTKCGTETSNWCKIASIWIFFIFSVVVYMVGQQYDCFCFDPIPYVSTFYHGLMHVISSIGHNMIILFDYY